MNTKPFASLRALPRPARDSAPQLTFATDPPTVTLLGTLPPDVGDCLGRIGVALQPEGADLTVLGTVNEPDRLFLHQLVRQHQPHLLLRYRHRCIVLGPFVVPGTNVCQGCLDAHEDDATTGEVIPRPAGLGHPQRIATWGGCAPSLGLLAAAWIACDVERYFLGQRPLTWSTTIELESQLGAITGTEYSRHPECACAWHSR